MIKELLEKEWDYTLYEVENMQILTVIFFGKVDVPRSFKLDPPVDINDLNVLDHIVHDIRDNYEKYKSLEIIPAIVG